KADFSLNPPSLDKAPIWATIKNIPSDLVTDEGLSFIAKPIGRVVDAKPFTTINSAEIKIIADLTKAIPKELEIEREDGNIWILTVSYPWLPSLCPICEEVGHKAAMCPKGSSVVKSEVPSDSAPPEVPVADPVDVVNQSINVPVQKNSPLPKESIK
ncbi:hypothetical protein EUTSA_v10002828mg, partial [Eutrema salsugineum]